MVSHVLGVASGSNFVTCGGGVVTVFSFFCHGFGGSNDNFW